jgi:hypothetical protein
MLHVSEAVLPSLKQNLMQTPCPLQMPISKQAKPMYVSIV